LNDGFGLEFFLVRLLACQLIKELLRIRLHNIWEF